VYPLAGNDPVGVYYLNNPTNVGLANVNVTVTRNPSGGNISGVGFTVMALSNPGNFPITNTAYLIQTGPASVDPIPLVVSSTGSFVVAGFSSSDGSGGVNITATPNLTLLHKGDFGSVQGFFGYEQNVSAGTNTYQFSFTGTKTFAAAVAFAAVPTAPSGPTLTSVAPNPVTGSSYAVTLGLTGSGFTGATAVLLTNVTAATGASYVPTVNSDTSISVSFVPGTAPTSWNATVVNVTPSAQVPFTVSAPPAISINSSSLTSAGPGNVVLSGTGGTAGQSYAVLSATNVTLPMASWTPLVTTVFGPGGSFSYTNVVNPGTPKLFLRIKQ
jgi:hypothetical protein